MPLDLTDDKSTLVQVMAWCRQAITWANVYPDLCHEMASLDLNELTHSGLRENGHHFADGIFKCILFNENFISMG